ncbi:MAG: 6-pyruvoyl-tetrahydropterin synthase-related protein, partial [Chloroflexota bacterium]
MVALVVWPWIRRDLRWNDVADAPNHLVRIFVIDAALGRGELYPRWLSDLYLGYGYPLLNFYAPGMYYLAAALHWLGMTVYASFQWTGVLAVALGVVGAYVLALVTGGGRRDAALVAAVVFGLSPYPFQTNLYVRAAVPEALALGLLPWLLLAAWGAWRAGGAWSAALALLTAALVLTHNISALIGMGLLVAWLLVLVSLGGVPVITGALRAGGAIALGVGLGAFFWLPALTESRYVQLDLALGGLYDPLEWLFDPLSVSGKVGRQGYPHTPLGPADLSLIFDYNAVGGFLPEKISLGQLGFWLFALAATAAGVLGRGDLTPYPFP